MTLYECHDRAERTAKITVPTFTWSPSDSLYHISVAEQQIQDVTNGIIKHAAVVTLDPASTNGQYTLPSDFLDMDEITWAPNDSTIAYWPINVVTPSAFREVAQLGFVEMPPEPLTTPDQAGRMFVMIEYGTLNVAPVSVGGVLRMRYRAHLTPYAPSDPVWSDFAGDPEATMRMRSLDTTMSSAFNGIVDYLVAQILMAQHGGVERFGNEIGLRMRSFEKSKYPVARQSVERGVHQTPQKLRPFGGMA